MTRPLTEGEDLAWAAAREPAVQPDPSREALIGVALFAAMVAAILVVGLLKALVGDFWMVSFAIAVALIADLALRDAETDRTRA